MDDQSDQEKRSPEPHFFVRPPGLEMAMGLALFTLCFTVFYLAQITFFIQRVINTTPSLAGAGFSFGLLRNDQFEQRWLELSTNGDAIAHVSLWSGLIGLIITLLLTWRWKGRRISTFLALRPASPRIFLLWVSVFAALFAVLEMIEHLFPDTENAFMAKVLGSSTNTLMLLIGMGIMPALFEEFLLRGLLYGSLRHLLDHHITIAIIAGLFTLLHPQYEWHIQLLVVLPMGVALGYARANSGSIWVPVLLHLLNNTASILLPYWWG